MSLERLMERQNALRRLNQLLRLRATVGDGNEWLDLEISEIEAFLREKEVEKS